LQFKASGRRPTLYKSNKATLKAMPPSIVIPSKIGRGKPITYHSPKAIIDEQVAELLGLHAGDGYVSCGVWGIRCNLNDETLVQHIIELARNVLGVEPSVRIRENTFTIRSGQKQAVHFFLKYGFPNGKKAETVQTPKPILSATDSKIIEAFLRGLFSSDGCFSIRKKDNSSRVDLMVRSKMLRDQFVALASKIGFSFNTCDAKRIKKGFTWKSTGSFYNANLCSRNAVKQWMKEVGSLCDTHIKKFNHWKN